VRLYVYGVFVWTEVFGVFLVAGAFALAYKIMGCLVGNEDAGYTSEFLIRA